jgi:hypothetical protein
MPLPNKSRNVFAAPVAKAYRPTMRDQVANVFSRALGDNYQSNELARGLFGSSGIGGGQGNLLGGLGILDLTPIGAAFALEEAGRQIGGGQPVTGAANVALGMVPIPAVAKGGKAAVKGVARRVAGKAAKAAPAPKPGFTAYHGSPHTFDQFDTAKIGTGEGAQAYGHGLYFAENEGVAKQYRDELTQAKLRDSGGYYRSAPIFRTESGDIAKGHPDYYAAKLLTEARELGVGKDWIKREANLLGLARDDGGRDIMRRVRKLEATDFTPENTPGSMYQVRINADPNDFLDWDRPLSEQSERVRQAMGYTGGHDEVAGARLGRAYRNEMFAGDLVGRDRATAPEVSQALAEKGVPGIRYLDQGSRGAGEGSRNFVVFDPRIIDIMKRYGVAAPVAAAILAGTMQPPKGKEPGA